MLNLLTIKKMFMHTVSLTATGADKLQQTAYSYSLVVALPHFVQQMLRQQQAFFTAQYGYVCGAPRLCIAHFTAHEAMEDTLLRYLQRIAGMQHALSVTLNNYSSIPEHTIYVRVQQPVCFQQWIQALQPIDNYISDNGFPHLQTMQRAHIPLAAALPPNVYRKAVSHYAQQVFYASFMATEWVLLKCKNNYSNEVPLCKFHLL